MITLQQKLRSAKRELAMRRKVYPNWIAAGRLKQSEADYEIEVMESIVADYQKLVDEISPTLGI